MILQLMGYAPDENPVAMPAANALGMPVQGIVSSIFTNCSGVVPTLRGFRGAPSPVTTPQATLAATCQGAATLTKLDGTFRTFAGSPTKLYEQAASTWGDVSRSAAYTTAETGRWRFAQLGNVSLAANGADTIQASVSSGPFSCVAGAPVAALIETVGAFVFAANTGATNQIQWAGINGYTSWASSIATQAGSNTIATTPGGFTAIKRFGNQCIAFKKDSMYAGTYVGPPNIWQFDLIPGKAGALSQEAVANIGTPDNPKLIFMGADDFYIYDGSRPVPIGTNRIKLQVFGSLLQSRYYACIALHDMTNSRVYFYYPVSDSVFPDHCVVYNYRMDKWGVDDRQIEAAFDYVAPGLTYSGLGGAYSTYSSLPNAPYGSAFVSSSNFQPGIFGTNAKSSTLTGQAGNTAFTTGDVGNDVQFYTLSRIRPRWLTAPSSASMINFYRNNTGDSLTQDQTTALSSTNTLDVVRDARWHRFQFNMSGDWETSSLDVEMIGSSLE